MVSECPECLPLEKARAKARVKVKAKAKVRAKAKAKHLAKVRVRHMSVPVQLRMKAVSYVVPRSAGLLNARRQAKGRAALRQQRQNNAGTSRPLGLARTRTVVTSIRTFMTATTLGLLPSV